MRDGGEHLREYASAVHKIDETVQALGVRAADALSCRRGCSSCCAPGLTVLPVEAAAIRAELAARPLAAFEAMPGHCAFLDVEGACVIYGVRPVLCRTHGLALKVLEQEREVRPGLHVVDDVSTCALNYTERGPLPAEILDVTKVLMLLTVVDRRFRELTGAPDARTPLASLAPTPSLRLAKRI